MKAGIVTHYHNSINYGGNLQAYALCRVLNGLGMEAEQIQVRMETVWLDGPLKKETAWTKVIRQMKRIVGFLPRRIRRSRLEKKYHIHKNHEIRRQSFSHFKEELIPHSNAVYDKNTIKDCLGDYDVFITGSDQVWNMEWYLPAFFLDFVPGNIPKFSYAASLGKDALTEIQKDVFKKSLSDFIGVSVREEQSVEILKNLSPVGAEWVLDPTLLLEKTEWDEAAADQVIEEGYIFCYYLGNNSVSRKIATEFAREKELKLVTIPFVDGYYMKCDAEFGDIRRSDISPEMFLALIRDAEYVFTDSFHALVFSHIFEKQYFLFQREEKDTMTSRIYSLCSLLDTTDRFCDTKEKCRVEYLDHLVQIDYSTKRKKMENMKIKSFEYLKNCLEKAETMF